jgi:cellulose synthase/poly-beta-1,6-N-acetylglucosamine synthase-like glycosyltransferase/peptidoglycan/xylan/chitin deacetylase (PgdA/CDA1 family)/spore germination protein YaaH
VVRNYEFPGKPGVVLSSSESPVFHDPEGRRWRRVRRTWLALAILVTALAGIFIASVLANPALPRFNLRPVAGLPRPVDLKPRAPNIPANPSEQKARRSEAELQHALANTKRIVPGKRRSQISIVPPPPSIPTPIVPSSRPLSIGFYINWDDSSYESLKRNLDHLDWVIPEWAHLQNSPDGSQPLVTDVHVPALNWIRETRPQVRILPMVQNLVDEKFDGQLLARSIADESHRQGLVNALLSFVQDNKFGGVCVDFEEPPQDSQTNLLTFIQELHGAFAAQNLLVVQSVPFADPDWKYKEFGLATDYLVLMAYDQHWAGSDAGPVAAQDWFEQNLIKRMHDLDPAKTIIALGNYGYDWSDANNEADEMTFQEALITARDSNAKPAFDPASRTPYYEYDESDESHHKVWFLDGVTAFNEMRAASGFKPAGFAIWRLGSEDPSIWSVMGSSLPSADGLRQINYGYLVDFEGNGELLKVVSPQPQPGARTVEIDPANGFIKNEEITATPSSYVIERTGDRPGLLAITFDDGPDPRWTPAILDVLKRENVPATFFIIGKNGQAYPDLVRRIVNEGHEIGNHTFTHPNLGEIPLSLSKLELTATQRLIESLVGRSTVLFRPPYFGDAEADKPQEVAPAYLAQQLGYIVVGLRIDPDDWQLPVTADEIVKRTVDRAMDANPETRGQVILLHDSGGDRSATVEALPKLINELKARGFRFVPVSELGGFTRDQVMPTIPASERMFTRADAVAFFFLSTGGWTLQWIFLIGILLGLGRLIFVGSLAFAQWLRSRRRERLHAGIAFAPFVSVIVPAYNEELVIANTIKSLLASDYENYEIIVVDDGSKDGTSKVVAEKFGDEARVRLLTMNNAGKAEALNTGLHHANGEIIIALDADTLFAPQTIGALAHRFFDPEMGALAGNAKVGNRVNIVTRWQALEYITSQNMDRRAFASLNCITVVPGAVGAWRKDLLAEAGGFPSDTLAEDQDLTLGIRRLGYKIGYEETAIAWTEAPDRLRTLARQRFRWAYGTLQCMWKHFDALFRPRYGALGFVAMPNVWIFQILFPLVSPVMDLMLIYTLVFSAIDRLQQPTGYSSTNLRQVLFYYALFLAIDWVSACFAFMLEKRERWSLLWWLFLQRFCYRQVMYYVMIKSVAMAVRGPVVGWGKLERKATAEAQP